MQGKQIKQMCIFLHTYFHEIPHVYLLLSCDAPNKKVLILIWYWKQLSLKVIELPKLKLIA